eukprot:TRINITY_DN46734_c0_g1_i1.p1 TRINITY_DN46734_c0_g1~~TRINITY_DN46734_c0_g1_i1.p1  ORF type:complete len:964 (+),score=245.25 TRINITY_DN46734_c0_g1_i1:47-2938(+)
MNSPLGHSRDLPDRAPGSPFASATAFSGGAGSAAGFARRRRSRLGDSSGTPSPHGSPHAEKRSVLMGGTAVISALASPVLAKVCSPDGADDAAAGAVDRPLLECMNALETEVFRLRPRIQAVADSAGGRADPKMAAAAAALLAGVPTASSKSSHSEVLSDLLLRPLPALHQVSKGHEPVLAAGKNRGAANRLSGGVKKGSLRRCLDELSEVGQCDTPSTRASASSVGEHAASTDIGAMAPAAAAASAAPAATAPLRGSQQLSSSRSRGRLGSSEDVLDAEQLRPRWEAHSQHAGGAALVAKLEGQLRALQEECAAQQEAVLADHGSQRGEQKAERQELSDMEQALWAEQTTLREVETRMSSLESSLEDQTRLLSATQRAYQRTVGQSEDAGERLHRAHHANQHLYAELDDARAEMSSLAAARRQLQEQLHSEEAARHVAGRQLHAAHRELDELQGRWDASQSGLQQAQSQGEAMHRELRRLRMQLEESGEVLEERRQLSGELQQCQGELADYRHHCQQDQLLVQKLRQENEQLAADLRAAGAYSDTLSAELRGTSEKAQGNHAKCCELWIELENSRLEAQRLRDALGASRREVQMLSHQLQQQQLHGGSKDQMPRMPGMFFNASNASDGLPASLPRDCRPAAVNGSEWSESEGDQGHYGPDTAAPVHRERTGEQLGDEWPPAAAARPPQFPQAGPRLPLSGLQQDETPPPRRARGPPVDDADDGWPPHRGGGRQAAEPPSQPQLVLWGTGGAPGGKGYPGQQGHGPAPAFHDSGGLAAWPPRFRRSEAQLGRASRDPSPDGLPPAGARSKSPEVRGATVADALRQSRGLDTGGPPPMANRQRLALAARDPSPLHHEVPQEAQHHRKESPAHVDHVSRIMRQGFINHMGEAQRDRQVASLEKELTNLNSERQYLENTLLKFPAGSNGRTLAERRQKREAEERLSGVVRTINELRGSLRQLNSKA